MDPSPTRSSVLRARQTWVAFLKDPARKKAIGVLEMHDDPESRCCLGHACAALGLRRSRRLLTGVVYYSDEMSIAPKEIVAALGLHDQHGAIIPPYIGPLHATFGGYEFHALTYLNDNTLATPQQIGEYLESVIEGGDGTPFRPLSDYPE